MRPAEHHPKPCASPTLLFISADQLAKHLQSLAQCCCRLRMPGFMQVRCSAKMAHSLQNIVLGPCRPALIRCARPDTLDLPSLSFAFPLLAYTFKGLILEAALQRAASRTWLLGFRV